MRLYILNSAAMTPRIEILPENKLIGQRIRMSIADDKTSELWCGLMPRRKEVLHPLTTDLLCLQVFDASLEFKDYDQDTIFDKGLRKQTDLNSLQDTDNHVIVMEVVFKAFSGV